MIFSRAPRGKKRPTLAKSCRGKSKMNEEIAKRMARKVSARGSKMHAYKCLYCKFPNGRAAWHIGHRQ